MKRWSYIVETRAKWILAIGAVLVVASGYWGLGVFSHLSGGGFEDPSTSSSRAHAIIQREFAKDRVDLLVLFSATNGTKVTDTSVAGDISERLAALRAHEGVRKVVDYYTTPSPTLLSRDKTEMYAVITLTENSISAQGEQYSKLAKDITGTSRVEVRFGGQAAINQQINEQTKRDLEKAEALSFPILAILLLVVFRSVVATLVPLVLGGLSILVAFLIVRGLTSVTEISVFAINIITLLGLGLAIDYSLFIVSRYREELADGKQPHDALRVTIQTAGRTIMFSGLTVILCLLGLTVFPQDFLRSMGLGGAAAVAATVLLALTVLPASLALLGRHINAWALPGLRASLHKPAGHGVWYRYSHLVMKRPVVTLVLSLGILLTLGLPFLSVRFTTPDATAAPTNLSSRQVYDRLVTNFAAASTSPLSIVVQLPSETTATALPQHIADYTSRVSDVKNVKSVFVAGKTDSYLLINATLEPGPQTEAARQVVRDVRALTPPSGWKIETDGETANLVDLLDSLRSHLPTAGLIILAATMLLLFLMLGSVVIPIKAAILNVLSLSAAFGLLTWVFQDGNLTKELGLITTYSLDATQPILIFAIAFGLAMDYEAFLLSRVKEEYDRSGDTTHAVAYGIQRTAGIITSAALMMVTVIGLFATGKIALIQQVGLGLAAAVVIDATIVRMMLVPAAMELLGHANWWAPAPLKRLSARLGLGE